MEDGLQLPKNKFSSPQEELAYLRAEVVRRENELRLRGEMPIKENLIQEKIGEYKELPAEAILEKSYIKAELPASTLGSTMNSMAESVPAIQTIDTGKIEESKIEEAKVEKSPEAITLKLSPEMHDEKMGEFLGIIQARGIKQALDTVAALNDPHLEDDFERFLVQYIKAGFKIDLKEKDPVSKSLRMTLFEVALPEKQEEADKQKNTKELVAGMEQFYYGMLSVLTDDDKSADYFTIELAVANHSDEFVFYVAVPDTRVGLFEKQLLSIFHNAKITEKNDDYNIFHEGGVTVGSVATQRENIIFPIKTYDQLDYDPLNVILNGFSKIARDGEGASIQIVFKPEGEYHLKRFKGMLDEVHKGYAIKDVIDNRPENFAEHAISLGKEILFGHKTKKKEPEKKDPNEELQLKLIDEKLASPIISTNIRIMASSANKARSEEIITDIESSFNQFQNTRSNSLKFKRLEKADLRALIHRFAFRQYEPTERTVFNLKEVTSLLHFPTHAPKNAPQLRSTRSATAPAPIDMPQPALGIYLGKNTHRNTEKSIYMSPEDRLRHFYVIGQTGTGKTTMLKNMIIQDIKAGQGVCMIDPHGSDIQEVLAHIPKERLEDVIYFDPAYTERPMALNMLEYDRRYPEQKTFVVNELFSIFQKLYGAVPESMGPMFEQYFRNATMLVIEDPDTGSTLLDVSRVMSNKAFREKKLANCRNPVVVQFWKEVAEKAGGEASLANIVPYITSKFDVFLANEIMRPIIAQEHSTFNFRDIMDNKKILLVNLSKGRLGDINANLIGLILIGKILMAALSRVDSIGKDLAPFYLYIDEFQNITTNSISTILSEARKYKLSLTIAHQFIAQLDEGIKNSVFGNVGSMAVFRVGAEDAEFLEKQFSPEFLAKDIMNIDNYNAYLKLLVNGKPAKPFNISTPAVPKVPMDAVESIKQLSYLKYGGRRDEIERDILAKYQK